MPLPRSSIGRMALLAVFLLTSGFALGPVSDTRDTHHLLRRLLRAAPLLDRGMARHVCEDSEPAWRAYIAGTGPRPLIDFYLNLQWAAGRLGPAEFAQHRARLEHAMLRVASALESAYHFGTPAWYVRRNMRRPPDEDYRVYWNMQRINRTLDTPGLSAAARLDTLDRVTADYRALGDSAGVESAQVQAAQLELELGRAERFRERLEHAYELTQLLGEHYLACQILGQLGSWHLQAGRREAGRACYARGVEIARRHSFPDQIARLMLFDARRALEEGHLALAANRVLEAQGLVEEFGGGLGRVRLTLHQARLFADLDCWDLVDRTLRRMPVLLRESGAQFAPPESVKTAFDLDLLRARAAFARGDADEGGRRLEHWVAAMPSWIRRVSLAQAFDVWSQGELRAGRWPECARLCARGLAHCDSAHVAEYAIPLALRLGRCLEAQGRLADARRVAGQAAGRIARGDGPEADDWSRALAVLEARLDLRAGDRRRGLARLAAAMADVRRRGGDTALDDASGACARTGLSARDAAHELGGLTPAEGYAFELAWRSRARRGAAAWPAGFEFRPPGRPTAGLHLVYHFLPDRLLRWSASRDGVVLDTLAVDPGTCLADVRRATELLRREPVARGQHLGPESARVLRRLATLLLPAELASGRSRPASLAVSPDGPLLALPFEALCVPAAAGLAPLALAVDVEYDAGWSAAPAPARGRSVVVSNPELPAGFQRLYAGSVPLQGSAAESECARRRWPDALLLSGRDATRANVLRAARGASHVYIAAHHVRDPGAPFLGFIPLAPEPGPWAGDAMIESADVRALDMAGCRLAVLASCASGAPYGEGEHPGPSLGDAFLDAGARAVVRSFWDVGDEETREFMARFLAADARAADPVAALNAARRAALRPGADVPPRVWAAWSVARTRGPEGGAPRAAGGPAPEVVASRLR